MAVTVHSYIAKLLSTYEEATDEPHSKIAGEMEIPVSNYYLYRNGKGNPTAKTIDKIIAVIQLKRPDIIIKASDWYLQQLNLEYRGTSGSAAPDREG